MTLLFWSQSGTKITVVSLTLALLEHKQCLGPHHRVQPNLKGKLLMKNADENLSILI